LHSAIVISERCHAKCRNGSQCKHKTLRGIYCYQHLSKLENLRIKKSSIPKAGLGLFPTKPVNRGNNITEYTGERIVSHDPNFGDDYCLQIKKNPPTYISARATNTPGLGRWVNANRGGTNNSKLIYNNNTRKAHVKATRNIPAGREVYAAYGKSYWQAKRRGE